MQAQSYRRRRKAREPLPDTTPKMAAVRGRQFPVGYSQGWLVYLVSAKMACKILRLSDVEGLAKTYLNAWKSGKVCCFHENCFPKRLSFTSEWLSDHYRIQRSQDRVSGDEEIKRRTKCAQETHG